eukprot:75976-Karenia_brevis.AAC.1
MNAASCGDKDVNLSHDFLKGCKLEVFHASAQCAERGTLRNLEQVLSKHIDAVASRGTQIHHHVA